MIDRIAPSSNVAGVLVLGALSLAATARSCGTPMVDPPSVVSDGAGYTAAWTASKRSGGAIYVQQFAAGDGMLAPRGAPVEVLRDPALIDGVSLVKANDGFLALARHHTPRNERSWENDLVAIPLDREGRAAGEPSFMMNIDVLCDHPVGRNGLVLVGFKQYGRSHQHPDDYLGVLALDSAGGYRGYWLLSRNPVACATAIRDDVLAIAWTYSSSKQQRDMVVVTLKRLHDRAAETSFELPATDVWVSKVRITTYRDGWAVLYADSAKVVHVVTTDARGDHMTELSVPAEVDLDSADLGVNERGLFVTWIASGISHVAAIGERSHHARRFSGRTPGETRAIGDGDRCVAAWTNRGGKRIRIVSEAGCP